MTITQGRVGRYWEFKKDIKPVFFVKDIESVNFAPNNSFFIYKDTSGSVKLIELDENCQPKNRLTLLDKEKDWGKREGGNCHISRDSSSIMIQAERKMKIVKLDKNLRIKKDVTIPLYHVDVCRIAADHSFIISKNGLESSRIMSIDKDCQVKEKEIAGVICDVASHHAPLHERFDLISYSASPENFAFCTTKKLWATDFTQVWKMKPFLPQVDLTLPQLLLVLKLVQTQNRIDFAQTDTKVLHAIYKTFPEEVKKAFNKKNRKLVKV
jgi:hypothetical protein